MTENHPSSRPATLGQTGFIGRAPAATPAGAPRSPGASAAHSNRPTVPDPNKSQGAAPLSPPGTAATGEGAGVESPAAVDMLRRIHEQLDRANRRSRQHDFSVLRLFGALLQMFAIVIALWGLLALTGERHDAAAARFALGCFLQLASIAAFAHDYLR